MWVYRLGAERAKRMLFSGDLVDGREAARLGLVLEAVPRARLDARVAEIAARIASVPKNQLMMQKLMVNQAYDAMGLANTQRFATLFDGITRHSPGVWFKRRAEVGFKQAVRERDGGAPIASDASRPLAAGTSPATDARPRNEHGGGITDERDTRPDIAALGGSTLCEAFQITAAQRPGAGGAVRTLGSATEITCAEFRAQSAGAGGGLHSRASAAATPSR
jgi:hypothetical protein